MTSNVEKLLTQIKTINPLQTTFLEESLKELPSEELDTLDAYIRFCEKAHVDIDYLATCYDLIVKDTFKEQVFFKRNKRYRYSSYDEVASKVYLNDEYMKKYMYGLAITSFLWPNHRAMKEFFLKTLPKDKKGYYLEIGPGHGFYFMQSMSLTSYDYFEGIDLSPTSAEMTRSIVSSKLFGDFENYDIYLQDFFEGGMPREKYDAVISGEVLEHLENPVKFLARVKEITHKDSYIYMTTCINAPAVDHIFLFETVEHVGEIVNQAGLTVKDQLVVPYFGLSVEETIEQLLPINIALEIKHPDA